MTATALKTWANSQTEEDAMNDDHAPLWKRMIELILEDNYEGKVVLDYGCNQGGFLKMLSNVSPFERAVGVDIAENSVKMAEKRLSPLPFTGGLPEILGVIKEEFDCAFSHEVLYLLPDLKAHAELIHSVLKPGGVYYAAIGCHTDQPQWKSWFDVINEYSNVPSQNYSLDDYSNAFFENGFTASVQPFRLRGFFPLKHKNPYFPKVTDSIRYYDNDKVLFRFQKEG